MRRRGSEAFTSFELLIVLTVSIVIILLVLPAIARKRVRASRVHCVNNLKNVGLAFRIFATDNNERFPFELSVTNGGTLELRSNLVAHFQAVSNELATPKILICPDRSFPMTAATSYTTLHRTNIGYFLSVSASENQSDSPLAGDAGFLINGSLVSNTIVQVTTNHFITYPQPFHASRYPIVFCQSDGTVVMAGSSNWTKSLASTSTGTNTFVVP